MGRLKRILERLIIRLMNKEQYIEWLRKKGVIIGEGCDIVKNANFGSEPWLIKIGNHVRITRGVEFITHDGGLWTLRHMGLIDKSAVKYGNIIIDDNCNISWNVIIMPNVRIGENSVIATGAVVTKDVPPGSVWGGIPARSIETIEEYYDKQKDQCVPTFSMSDKEKQKYLRKHKPELFG